jgi:hypothetical protein
MKLSEPLYDAVYGMLLKIPETRSCDMVLAEQVWNRQMRTSPNILLRQLNCSKITAVDLFNYIKEGYLSSLESIGRARRKIQEKNQSLKNEQSATNRKEREVEVRQLIGGFGQASEHSRRTQSIAGKYPYNPEQPI